MSTYLPAELLARLEESDRRRCAYCQTTEANTGLPMTVDHIIPESQGGRTIFANVCLCCHRCNEYKGAKTQGQDPLTGETVPLFNPRTQIWREHFAWDEASTRVIGLTAVGRATMISLNMNNATIVSARRRWVGVGWHPPD